MFYLQGIQIKGLSFIIVVFYFSNTIYVHIISLYLYFNVPNTNSHHSCKNRDNDTHSSLNIGRLTWLSSRHRNLPPCFNTLLKKWKKQQ